MTVAQACEQSGADYPVIARPAHFEIDGEFKPGLGVQIVRSDTWQALGYASKSYHVIQNREAFDVVGGLIGDGIAGVMTAGVLGIGERAWMQFVLGEIGVDKIDRGIATLLVVNDHQAAKAATFAYTTVWVVCANTEAAARRQYEGTGKYRQATHTGDTTLKLETVKASLNLAEKAFRDWNETAKQLAAAKLNDPREAWRLALASLAPAETTIEGWEKSSAAAKASKTYWSNMVGAIMREYRSGVGQDIPSRQSTAWGAFNGVTSWVDYVRSPKTTGAKRVEQVWFGSGNEIKNRAAEIAVDHFLGGNPWPESVTKAERLLAVGV